MPEATLNYADKFAGCLVGLAVGEALGSPLEGKSRAEIAEQYSQPVRDYLATESIESGSSSTATFRALQLAESLVRTAGKLLPTDFTPPMLTALSLLVGPVRSKTMWAALQNEQATSNYQAGPTTGRSVESRAAARIAPLGLLYCYGSFEAEQFRQDCATVARLTHNQPVTIQATVAVAGAVRALCRQEIMPEDLMALALDLIPPGYLDLPLAGNPLRQKLLAAQDYIEERQTFVDNVLANDLDVDIFRVDLNNMLRCGTHGSAAETVAAAFFAFVACKDSFEEAVVLAINAGGSTATIGAITGALAGAYHGLAAIPARWRESLPGSAKIVETAQALHEVAARRTV